MYAVREWSIDFVEQSHINNARNWIAAVCHEIKERVSLERCKCGERYEQWGRWSTSGKHHPLTSTTSCPEVTSCYHSLVLLRWPYPLSSVSEVMLVVQLARCCVDSFLPKPVDKDTRSMVEMEMGGGKGPNDKSGYYGPRGGMFWNGQKKQNVSTYSPKNL